VAQFTKSGATSVKEEASSGSSEEEDEEEDEEDDEAAGTPDKASGELLGCDTALLFLSWVCRFASTLRWSKRNAPAGTDAALTELAHGPRLPRFCSNTDRWLCSTTDRSEPAAPTPTVAALG
jgi:hypothetical protein